MDIKTARNNTLDPTQIIDLDGKDEKMKFYAQNESINILDLSLKAVLNEGAIIRAACFSPNGKYIGLGTNSKSIKLCHLPRNLIFNKS